CIDLLGAANKRLPPSSIAIACGRPFLTCRENGSCVALYTATAPLVLVPAPTASVSPGASVATTALAGTASPAFTTSGGAGNRPSRSGRGVGYAVSGSMQSVGPWGPCVNDIGRVRSN